MRYFLFILFVLVAPRPAVANPVSIDSLQRVAEQLLPQQIESLEKQWNIRFDRNRLPKILIGDVWHEQYLTRSGYLGAFFPDSGLVTLALPDTGQPWPNMEIYNHELIHVYVDNTSQGLGLGPWPGIARERACTRPQLAALRMQCEGLATAATVSRDGLDFKKWKQYLPVSAEHCFLPDVGNRYVYLGGRMMIQPLIDQAGLKRTSEYVVQHPVRITGRSFKQDLINWVERAKRDLKSKEK